MWFSRDLLESRQRYESMVGELKRKESVIREMQQRLEASEGCKFLTYRLVIDLRDNYDPLELEDVLITREVVDRKINSFSIVSSRDNSSPKNFPSSHYLHGILFLSFHSFHFSFNNIITCDCPLFPFPHPINQLVIS